MLAFTEKKMKFLRNAPNNVISEATQMVHTFLALLPRYLNQCCLCLSLSLKLAMLLNKVELELRAEEQEDQVRLGSAFGDLRTGSGEQTGLSLRKQRT